jgi:nucleoside-diphosphate-sugar epimerase
VKVLLTGHHGYIGSVCARLLAEAGHDVVGLDTLFYRDCDLASAAAPSTSELMLDVRDVRPEQLEGFDAVVHLAALSNDPIGDFSPELTREINFEATVSLARAARDAGVGRFVFSSSCSMYGAADGDRPVDETAPLRPLTEYARSKVRSETVLLELADDGFSPVLMRNATVYGVSPRLRVDLVLNNLVAWAVTTGRIHLMSDGTPWRPLVHVEDIARAFVAALEAPEDVIRGEAFNVGRDRENYQVRQLGDIVQEVVPGSEVEYAGSGDPDPRSYRVSFAKLARAFPDLELTWTARTGAEELAAAYKAASLSLDEFESDRFTRLKRLRTLLERGELDSALRWRAAA